MPDGETKGRHDSFCKQAAANDSTHLIGNSRRFRTTPCDLDVSLSLQGGRVPWGPRMKCSTFQWPVRESLPMSRLRHEIPSDFAQIFAWHDVVKIATSLGFSARACRNCDKVMPRNSSRETVENFMSQVRHHSSFERPPPGLYFGGQLARPARSQTATEASAIKHAFCQPDVWNR